MLKIRFNFALLLVSSFLLAGCSSGPDIRADYDPDANFAEFRTYNFFDPLSIENPDYSTIHGQIFRDAISREMESRGYIKSDNPDLLLNVSARLQDKTRVTTHTDPAPGYYGYRRGRYGAWGGYGYSTSTHVSEYTEGTVNVDMVDAGANRLVWESVGVGRLKKDRSSEELREDINSAIASMFAEFPFSAGE